MWLRFLRLVCNHLAAGGLSPPFLILSSPPELQRQSRPVSKRWTITTEEQESKSYTVFFVLHDKLPHYSPKCGWSRFSPFNHYSLFYQRRQNHLWQNFPVERKRSHQASKNITIYRDSGKGAI